MAAACEASDTPMSGVGVARAAEVQVSVSGMSRKVVMGGFALAEFPDKNPEEMRNLAAGEHVNLIWKQAHFVGTDPLLGIIEASLRNDLSSGGLVSSSSALLADGAVGGSFFPAINRNEFHFQLRLPRLGMTMKSDEPIVNSARIEQIPPVGSIYQLERAVKFSRDAQLSSVLSVVMPSVEITSCNVRLHVAEGIDLRIVSHEDDGSRVTFTVEAVNRTGSDKLGATWMIWPPPPSQAEQPKGTISMDGVNPQRFTFSADRDIFYQARWIAASASFPFEKSASAAVAVPGLA